MRSGTEIIVPGHRRWREFVSRLSRARFCSGTTELELAPASERREA